METRRFGKTDMQVSVLGFGGAEIGLRAGDGRRGRPPARRRARRWAQRDRHGRVLSRERRENRAGRRIAEAMCSCSPSADTRQGSKNRIGAGHAHKADRSKSGRLRTDYLDLIQLHTCSETNAARWRRHRGTPRERLAKRRLIGYSGDDTAAKYAIESAHSTPSRLPATSPTSRHRPNLAECAERGMGVIAKRPIANAVWHHAERPENAYHQPYYDRIQQLRYDFLGRPRAGRRRRGAVHGERSPA